MDGADYNEGCWLSSVSTCVTLHSTSVILLTSRADQQVPGPWYNFSATGLRPSVHGRHCPSLLCQARLTTWSIDRYPCILLWPGSDSDSQQPSLAPRLPVPATRVVCVPDPPGVCELSCQAVRGGCWSRRARDDVWLVLAAGAGGHVLFLAGWTALPFSLCVLLLVKIPLGLGHVFFWTVVV